MSELTYPSYYAQRLIFIRKPLTHERAARFIVARMCRAGHMNGWFGDVGLDFRRDEARNLERLTAKELRVWLDNNISNLIRDCGVNERIINALMSGGAK